MGTLVGIYIAECAGGPMRAVQQAELVSGQGIAGDRYFAGRGKFSPAVQDESHQVTLIEIEQIERFNSANGMTFGAADLRRNLVTEGIGLNNLVGSEFAVGDVVLKGVRLCEPCEYLARLTHPVVLGGLVHCAGLRAAVVRGGSVRVADRVAPDANRRPDQAPESQ
jgi:MOSC domain-containing protein YiiM